AIEAEQLLANVLLARLRQTAATGTLNANWQRSLFLSDSPSEQAGFLLSYPKQFRKQRFSLVCHAELQPPSHRPLRAPCRRQDVAAGRAFPGGPDAGAIAGGQTRRVRAQTCQASRATLRAATHTNRRGGCLLRRDPRATRRRRAGRLLEGR